MTAHRPGTSLPNSMRDRSAMARAGVSNPETFDQSPEYDSEERLFPEESRLTFGGKRQVGWCPCGFAAVEDAHGTGVPACAFCGAELAVQP